MAVSAFGFGTPFSPSAPSLSPFGLSPSSAVTVNPFMVTQALPSTPTSAFNPYASQPVQQIIQLLQVVPQYVQQLVQLEYLQQHQLQQLQQIVQHIPAQLAHLQQLIQFAPHQLQHQLQQPFSQIGGGLSGLTPWGVSPQPFGPQPNYVM